MADDVVIRAEGLGKKYLIGHAAERERHPTLRDVMVRGAHNLCRKTRDMARGRAIVAGDEVEEFWALKDVSFEVRRGEVLGIIGRNGAGKSTLLKILSRITEPSEGRVTIRGRVASLLEVGTGFHPELTGRENIYLNGAILGMNRTEIRRKFEEIVAFAEIDKFLDTPVKRYSSGMYVRLAFAVAAHLEPEILVVDEVLAVGDAEFQKKCLGKMNEVSRREGRTVLFVSHNLAAIAELANRAALLDKGSVAIDGRTSEVISTYLSKSVQQSIYVSSRDYHDDSPHVARAEVLTSSPNGLQDFGEPLAIAVWVRHGQPLVRGHVGVQLINQSQIPAATLHAYPPTCTFGRESGTTLIRFHIPKLRLNIGRFYLRIWVTEPPGGTVYEIVDACGFEVIRHSFLSWWNPEICTYHEEFTASIVAEIGMTFDRAQASTTGISTWKSTPDAVMQEPAQGT